MLRNRERVLTQLADLQKKLYAAEKVEIYRRIRVRHSVFFLSLKFQIFRVDCQLRTRIFKRRDVESFREVCRGRRVSLTKSESVKDAFFSLSGARSKRQSERVRRHSNSYDDSELISRVETDYTSDHYAEALKNPRNIYNRLAASVYKYQYLHKVNFSEDI